MNTLWNWFYGVNNILLFIGRSRRGGRKETMFAHEDFWNRKRERERRMKDYCFNDWKKEGWGSEETSTRGKEGRKLARRSSKRAFLVVSWDIFNSSVSVIHRTVVSLGWFRDGEVERSSVCPLSEMHLKEFFISRVYIYIYVLVTRCTLLTHRVKFQIKSVPVRR